MRQGRFVQRGAALVALAAILVLVGCSSPAPNEAAAPGASQAPARTAACPTYDGGDLPPGCAPYDPEEVMDVNERHRERMALDPDAEAANAAVAGTLRDALEQLRGDGGASVDGVRKALDAAGLGSPQVREDYGRILFGAGAPAGGCLYGEIAESGVVVDVGGFILDGGCLPAQ